MTGSRGSFSRYLVTFSFCFSFAKLQEEIASLTEISAANQLLLYKNQEFTQMVAELALVKTYPKTSQSQPVFLFSTASEEFPPIRIPEIRELSRRQQSEKFLISTLCQMLVAGTKVEICDVQWCVWRLQAPNLHWRDDTRKFSHQCPRPMFKYIFLAVALF